MLAREELHRALDKLQVPIEFHLGAAVPRQSLKAFMDTPAGYRIMTSNPIIADTICGNFTEGTPNLDAVREKFFKTDPKPFNDAATFDRYLGQQDGSEFDPKVIMKMFGDVKDRFNNPNLFIDAIYGHVIQGPDFFDMRNLTFRGKVDPKIRPDMSWETNESQTGRGGDQRHNKNRSHVVGADRSNVQ